MSREKAYDLWVDGRSFCSSTGSEQLAEKEAEFVQGIVRDYGVRICAMDPKTRRVTKWVKTEGFSVWT